MSQEELRKNVKIAKALNDDILYKDFADYLNIDHNSFYNWLHGYYRLSIDNAKKLYDVVIDLIN